MYIRTLLLIVRLAAAIGVGIIVATLLFASLGPAPHAETPKGRGDALSGCAPMDYNNCWYIL
jgi:hypothetical protein